MDRLVGGVAAALGSLMGRIRFSLRFLLGTLTLAGVFLASWNLFEQRAVSDVESASGGWSPQVVVPYVLRVEKSDNVTVTATHHLWCFGLILDLPGSHRFPAADGFSSVVRPRIIIQHEEDAAWAIGALRGE